MRQTLSQDEEGVANFEETKYAGFYRINNLRSPGEDGRYHGVTETGLILRPAMAGRTKPKILPVTRGTPKDPSLSKGESQVVEEA